MHTGEGFKTRPEGCVWFVLKAITLGNPCFPIALSLDNTALVLLHASTVAAARFAQNFERLAGQLSDHPSTFILENPRGITGVFFFACWHVAGRDWLPFRF